MISEEFKKPVEVAVAINEALTCELRTAGGAVEIAIKAGVSNQNPIVKRSINDIGHEAEARFDHVINRVNVGENIGIYLKVHDQKIAEVLNSWANIPCGE
jgi:hypothetical protein